MSYLKRFTKVLRGSLSTTSRGEAGTFHLPLRKLVLRYSQTNASSAGMRTFLLSARFGLLTQKYPSVEFVVDHTNGERHALVTGFYAAAETSGRSKQVNLANLDAGQVEAKLKQVVESSGAKIKSWKRRNVQSSNHAARGVWSQLHDKPLDI
ncbi:mitochondrial 54S ribosomal protein mL43 [Mycosarcoma maydis]|uniref:Large ribosomal subunit protein mL43 n=1 Tax=Mycosarcoma maydis TaxID=5270 RepID=A0A0D1CPS8_MYCMD|nr:mitochondrial 54S ribosomal protein MRPL51 [Ustilago maydis 521]KIS68583.1 hypothetical protein UMAG_10382 [Ustilago maydis 521]|eukprot:XP_011389771.1 hypothetical protein UMAG_10382 [Ustilago maydis 521]